MRFTPKELLRAGNHKWKVSEVDPVIYRNIEDLCRKINALGYEPPMYASSCLRSLEDQKRINPKAIGSAHLYGCAVDIKDPDRKLARWVLLHEKLLCEVGLWVEHSGYTNGWLHLQSQMPKSGNRFFIP